MPRPPIESVHSGTFRSTKGTVARGRTVDRGECRKTMSKLDLIEDLLQRLAQAPLLRAHSVCLSLKAHCTSTIYPHNSEVAALVMDGQILPPRIHKA